MTARTFNPFDLEKPTLKLGEYGEYTLGDLTEARLVAIQSLAQELEGLGDTSTPEARQQMVSVIARITEAACENATGIADRIIQLHAEGEIGLLALNGVAEFVMSWVGGESSAGEG